jgi:hypothetical protein
MGTSCGKVQLVALTNASWRLTLKIACIVAD